MPDFSPTCSRLFGPPVAAGHRASAGPGQFLIMREGAIVYGKSRALDRARIAAAWIRTSVERREAARRQDAPVRPGKRRSAFGSAPGPTRRFRRSTISRVCEGRNATPGFRKRNSRLACEIRGADFRHFHAGALPARTGMTRRAESSPLQSRWRSKGALIGRRRRFQRK